MQQWTINYFDRLLITFYLTLQDVGAYDFAFKCLMIIDLVLGGLNNSFLPKVLGEVMQQDHKQSTVEMNRYYHGLVAACMILVTGAVVVAPFVLQSRFIGRDYGEAIYYLPLMSVIYLVKSIRFYFSLPYGSLKYSKPLPLIYLAISVIKIGLMVLLIPTYGVKAVIFSAIVSGLTELVLLKYFIQAQFTFKFNKFKLIVAPLALGLLIVITELLDVEQTIANLIYLAACSLTLWWLYRKELRLIKIPNLFR
jgi:O-antigen/teichoic acid export membrane protein